MRVFFYPHAYLRDRQLDTIRSWQGSVVINPELAAERAGRQVGKADATRGIIRTNWKQKIPLLNAKFRPAGLKYDDIVYVWGGVVLSGPFIVDLDNPYSLVGYNLSAMPLWRPLLKLMLASPRCREIRCMSEACRQTLLILFGEAVHAKAVVRYPRVHQEVKSIKRQPKKETRFLFVGTQFEIKGGGALLRAWRKAAPFIPNAQLNVITHLPKAYVELARSTPQLTVHEASFSREEIWSRFMLKSDVLILPTYVESFGMVVLEALAHGLAIISTDVYALAEMVEDNRNGHLLTPPISVWSGFLPSSLYYNLKHASRIAARANTSQFEANLTSAIVATASNPRRLLDMRRASVDVFNRKFR